MSCLAGFMPEEFTNESLVAHRDSSVATLPQNDNSGRVSSKSSRDSSVAITPSRKRRQGKHCLG
ncbi:hypothetical protein [Helicobacter marmotae]|uniref:hypothetical protein n=1 Tax=Helicobacter marmotae TaxID=152490 RepID=UPI0011C02C33|nr:hypothetical protein [Helicobacter marmotae]